MIMRDKLIKAFVSHARGHIDKHVVNVEVLLEHPAGVGEHGDLRRELVERADARRDLFVGLFGALVGYLNFVVQAMLVMVVARTDNAEQLFAEAHLVLQVQRAGMDQLVTIGAAPVRTYAER